MPPDNVRRFGRPELHEDGRGQVDATQLHRLVAYLAVRAGWVSRDEVNFRFWRDHEHGRPRAQLVHGVVASSARPDRYDPDAAAELSPALQRADPVAVRVVRFCMPSLATAGLVDAHRSWTRASRSR